MSIVASYRTKCDRCGYLRLQYGSTEQDAVANAIKAGWSAYPLLCPVCRSEFQARAVSGVPSNP